MNATKCSTGDSNCASGRSPEHTQPRLAALALSCLLALALVLWIKTNISERVSRLEESFATIESESFFLGAHARESLVRLNSMLLRYQLSGDLGEQARFRQLSQALHERLETNASRLSTAQERQIAERLQSAFAEYLDATVELRERSIRGVRKDSASVIQEQLDERSRAVLALADEFAATQRAAMRLFFTGSQNALNSLQNLLWLALLLILLLIGAVTVLAYRTLVAPLRMQLSESQSQVERHEKLASLGALAAGVAHEIRNPLTAIKFRLFSLKKVLPDELHDNEDLATIGSEVNRLERIVKDFLQFARPSDPVAVKILLGGLIAQVIRLLHDELAGRGIELRASECAPVTVRGDQQQLQQVLINLIRNGAESISSQGTITLSARRGAAKLSNQMQPAAIIEVIDTGKGISAEAEKRLFDPFFSTKESGTGLGLPIAARIIEKHGGHIQYSTRANEGTTFSVVLPISAKDESENPVDRR